MSKNKKFAKKGKLVNGLPSLTNPVGFFVPFSCFKVGVAFHVFTLQGVTARKGHFFLPGVKKGEIHNPFFDRHFGNFPHSP